MYPTVLVFDLIVQMAVHFLLSVEMAIPAVLHIFTMLALCLPLILLLLFEEPAEWNIPCISPI